MATIEETGTINYTGTSNSDSNLITDTNNSKKRNLRQRSSIYYGIFDLSSDDDLDSEKPRKESCVKNSKQSNDTNASAKKSKREKESPKRKPEEGNNYRPKIEEAPVFYPNEEEFKDTLGYIAKIRSEAEKFGICKIIPPKTWAPPCPLKENDFYKRIGFTTRLQEVNKLQNREPVKKRSKHRRKRRRKGLRFGINKRRNNINNNSNNDENNDNLENNNECESDSEEKFGFQTGSDFTLAGFEEFANKFKEQYFQINGENNNNNKEKWGPSVEEIEGEYWRIVEEADEEVEVHYGADLDTALFGSGFPKTANSNSDSNLNEINKYKSSGWNLNNLPRLPKSVLSFEKEEISGVLVPWLYVGMCFSSFCWHVEDHYLYSLNYMHFGEPKVWYGVSGTDANKLEKAMKKHLPELFAQQPDLLHELVTQLSPTVLKSEGIEVYRLVQNPQEFILTFPRAYHSGFNCGFNCAEAVNLAPSDWLPHGLCAVQSYREQKRKTSISHDKLLLVVGKEAARELWVDLVRGGPERDFRWSWKGACGKDGILTQAVKVRVEMEKKARENLNPAFKLKKIEKYSDCLTEKECFSCFYDLHLSGCICDCYPSRYACLNHIQLLCSCEPSKRSILFRYDLEELNILVSALEGDLTAIKRWAEIDKNNNNNKSLDLNIKSETDKDIKSNIQGHFRKSSPIIFGVDLAQSQSESQSLKYSVELVEIGSVMRGNSWSCKEAIFTKGFKSRVQFFSVLDPTKRCNYISEVLDAGVLGPLFKVKMEERPDISFTQASPVQCWNLLQERLNQEILKLTGQTGRSDLVYPESVNGFAMFGFLSPNIIHLLECQDPTHRYVNYWASKELCTKPPEKSNISTSTPASDISPQKLFGVNLTKKEAEKEKLYINSDSSPEEIQLDQSTLKCLFKKASIEELKVMYKVFSSGSGSQSWRSAFEVLSETLSDQLTDNN